MPSFHKISDVWTFKIFLRFVAVTSLTADRSLLQPTVCVNNTSYVHFSCVIHMHTHGSSLGPHSLIPSHVSCALLLCMIVLSLRRLHFPLLPHHFLSDHLVLPSARQLYLPGCGGQIPCALPPRTLAPLPSTSLPQEQGDLFWYDNLIHCLSRKVR